MANQIARWILAAALTPLPGITSASAQDNLQRGATGFLTSRLSPREMKTWKSIEEIVLRRDHAGRPLNPTLQALWQAAQASGYPIYIEMNAGRGDNPYFAGQFAVEELDPQGKIISAVVRLFPKVIDKASTRKGVQRVGGFIPFRGLTKTERYAETLGHELQHVLLILQNPEYARLARELVRVKADFYQLWRRDLTWKNNKKEMEESRNRLHDLSIRLEEMPERIEVKIWEELANSRNAL